MTARRRPADGRRPAAVHGAAPRILVSGARAAYVGPGLALAPHRNAATTIAMALEAPFSLAVMAGSRPRAYAETHAALIPSGTRHHLVAAGAMAFVYLDALSDDHYALRGAALDAARERLAACGPAERAAWTVDAIFGALGIPPRPAPDARIEAVVRAIDARPQDFGTIEAAAACVPLSPSRFRALFRAAVGMPFRRYRLWRRMGVVLEAASAGVSLTTAAQDAGFASSAHLSAAFREMFGMSPSALLAAGARLEPPPASPAIRA